MMRKFGFFIAGALACLPLSLSANYCGASNCGPSCYSDCCDIDWCGGWNIYADYIYWTPRSCNTDFALINDAVGSQVVASGPKCVDPSYDSGFRVGLTKYFDCFDLGVRYTYLRPCDTSSLTNDALVITPTRIGQPTTNIVNNQFNIANAKYKVELDIVEVEVGHEWDAGCCGCMRTFGGFKYVRLDQKFTNFFQDTITMAEPGATAIATYASKADLNMYGLYMGLEGRRSICDFCGCGDFGLFGSLSVGTLVACSDRNATYAIQIYDPTEELADPTTQINLDGCDGNVLVANIDLEVGVYIMPEFDCLCGSLSLMVGYEFHSFINTPEFLVDVQPAAVAAQSNVLAASCDNVSFDGLFVRLGYCF